MATASTDFKRLFVRGLKWDATDAGITFAEALKAASRAKLVQNSTGKFLSGATGNGQSVQFQIPLNGRDLTPTVLAEVCGEILDRYDLAQTHLVAAGNASPTDDQIYTQLLSELEAVKGYTSNFLYLSK